MNERLVNQEFLITLSFNEALKSLQDEKKIIDLVSKCENYSTSTTYIEEILRDSFVVKFLEFSALEKMQKFFNEGKYRPASFYELIPLLVQFPKLRQFKLAATGTYVIGEFDDHFNLVQIGTLGCEYLYLSTYCLSEFCFKNIDRKNLFILGVKN